MAVSNPATMSSVYAEFGAPAGTPLSAFLRGGSWVPNVATNNNVPTSLPIKLSQLAGAVHTTPINVTANNVSGATSSGIANEFIVNGSISATGGIPPYTYNTVYKSGTSFIIGSATTTTPSFTRSGNPPAGTATGTYTVTVTDSTSTSASKDFTVTDNRT